MKAIQKILFKNLKHIEADTIKEGKKEITVPEYYKLTCDDESSEQQVLRINSENENLLGKLKGIQVYSKLIIVTEVYFYNNKPSKVEVIDIVGEASEIQTVENIINQYVKD